nr:hypothetical protein [Tanacetum cinerariifolium]
MPRAAGRIEGVTGVQGAAVVETPQLPGFQALTKLKAWLARHFDEAPIGAVIRQHQFRREVERPAQEVRHTDFRNLTQSVQRDHGSPAAVVAAPVLVAKLHRDFAQQTVGIRVLLTQRLRDREAVDEAAVASLGVVHQAMQKLQAGLQLTCRQVGVQRQVEGGVGVTVGIGSGLHVEQHAEIALANERYALSQRTERTRHGGHAPYLGQPDVAYRQQPVEEGLWVLHHCL